MNNSTIIYLGIILLLSTSIYFLSGSNFQKSNNNGFNFGAFSIDIPKDWKKIEYQGIDSYVGGITNGTDSLTFDYGWYSYSFNSEDVKKQLFATATINGKIALLTKPKEVGNGTIGIYIEKAYKKNRFNLIGENIEDENLIFDIFKSIKFKDSDTTINSKHFEFSNIITPYSGQYLFNVNCAACHHKTRNTMGPAFASIDELNFKKWILDTTDFIKADTTKYGIGYHRNTFGKLLTENDIEKLIEYSKSE